MPDNTDLHINNLLCFLNGAFNDYSQNVLHNLIYSFYSIEEIKSSKELLGLIIKKDIVNRRDPDRKRKELDDLFEFYNEWKTNTRRGKFLADCYKKLPPVGMEFIAPILVDLTEEVAKLNEVLPKIADIKTEVVNTADTVRNLKKDLISIKNCHTMTNNNQSSRKFPDKDEISNFLTDFRQTSIVNLSNPASTGKNINSNNNDSLTLIAQVNKANNENSSKVGNSKNMKNTNTTLIDSVINDDNNLSLNHTVSPSSYNRVSEKIVDLQKQIINSVASPRPSLKVDTTDINLNSVINNKSNLETESNSRNMDNNAPPTSPNTKRNDAYDDDTVRQEEESDGWTVHHSKNWRRNNNRRNSNRGKTKYQKSSSRVTGQKVVTNQLFKSSNKSVDLFLGNVDKSTNIKDINDYISENFKIDPLDVTKLDTKTDYCNCYKIKVLLNDRDELFNGALWPSGVIINKFYIKRYP